MCCLRRVRCATAALGPSSRISSISPSIWTPTRTRSKPGTSNASNGCARSAFRDPRSYFSAYAALDEKQADAVSKDIWRRINLENLRQNIAPTRPRASLILTKGADHRVAEVALRKL